ncbi:hypothetical protein TIFTF001_004526 [Ficus carica]|uniref:Uncharacterized protein n=1 Tax=Ficus carica TaxID=3494 RepID=A0AA87ZGH2_FICCA|nr:hypothetical protein TIFTF001_004526 [Ficus carica]
MPFGQAFGIPFHEAWQRTLEKSTAIYKIMSPGPIVTMVVADDQVVDYWWETDQSNGDIGGVSATNTLMLKSVMALMSKQRSRALARKNCPYLSRLANPAVGADDRTGTVTDGVRCQAADAKCRVEVVLSAYTGWHDAGSEGPTEQVVLSSFQENFVRADNTGPDLVLPKVGSGNGSTAKAVVIQ